jgi:uncharacterized iron-regulated membrane protein
VKGAPGLGQAQPEGGARRAAAPPHWPRPARAAWLRTAHRWLGLLLALPLGVLALSGALLAAGKPLDEWLQRPLFQALAATSSPSAGSFNEALDLVHGDLRQRYGHDAGFTLRLPQQPSQSLRVFVRAPAWEGMAFYDPASARWLGQRGRTEGWWPWLFELHTEAFAGERGKAAWSISAALGLGLLVLGGALWWRGRSGAWFAVAWRSAAPRRWRDLHRVGGALALPVLLAIVLSGLYMAWQPLRGWVSQALNEAPVKPPALPRTVSSAGPVPLSALVQRARAPWPEGHVVYVTLRPGQATRVRLKLPQDPHPNGLSSVWLDPRDGRELARVRVDELDAGQRWVSWIYPLHSAQLLGPWQRGLWTLLGLLLALLAGSGVWLWWWRRRLRAAPPAGRAGRGLSA